MAERRSTIIFNYLYRFSFNHRTQIKLFISTIFKAESVPLQSIDYIFCSDDYLLSLNIQFLSHHTLTDTISFTLSPKKQPVIGEIYISIDRIRENAKSYSISFRSELLRVMFHGALHLCGFNDKTPSEKAAMTVKEDEYLGKFNQLFPRGTIHKKHK